jgi:anti-sigma B factor antagonist
VNVEFAEHNDVMVAFVLADQIDASSAGSFRDNILGKIEQGHKRIVLDLTKVDFIDSSGLGAIISALKHLGEEGELAICGVNEPVMSLFRLTRMNRIFNIFDTQEEAVAALGAKKAE